MTDWLRNFVVIDVETTGLDPFRDRIIELGFARYEQGQLVARGDYFVNPEGRSIPEHITQLTGIGVEHVMDAPPFYHVYNQIAPHLYGATPVAYNASFDRKFLMHSIFRSWPRHAFNELPWALQPGYRWVDVLGLARALVLEIHKHKLGLVAEFMGIPLREQHRADEDCITTAELLRRFISEWRLDWSYAETVARARRANYEKARKTFFWKQKEREDKAWLPQGDPIMVYECDVCHEMGAGAFTRKGWTIPEYWAYYGRGGDDQRLTCGPACDAALMWHDSFLGLAR